MSIDARSAHFRRFAALLMHELDAHDFLWLGVDDEEQCRTLLARRAYDLVCHALNASGYGAASIGDVPDLAAWPLRREEA